MSLSLSVQVGAATLYCGNCLEILPELSGIDAVITDPPYSSGATHATGRKADPAKKYLKKNSANRRLPNFEGDMRDQRSFVTFNTIWTTCAFDKARDGAVMITFCDWRQIAVTTDYLQCGGWTWRGIASWHKKAARPYRGRFAAEQEYAVWGSKGAMPADRGVPPLRGVFVHSIPSKREHITQKPLGLMEDLVAICVPGGLVCDPFMGSGTTGVAALNSGRRFIGIEKSPELFAIAVERIRTEVGGSP